MRLFEKNDWHIFSDLDELYQRAKFGEDRTTRTSCSCENMVFVLYLSRFVSGALFVRGALCGSLWVDFDSVFTLFFGSDGPFRWTR